LALQRYRERPVPQRFLCAVLIGLIGMLVKSTEIFHLYLIAAVFLFSGEGWRALRVPAYWLAFIALILVIEGWAHVMDANNLRHFPEWTSGVNLAEFIGKPWNHVNPSGYLQIALYLTLLVLTPVGLPVVVVGIRQLFRARPWRLEAWWV